MLRFVAPAMLALMLAIGAPADAVQIGEEAPTFTLPALNGSGTYTNEGCRDKRAQLVIFWSSY